MTWIEYAIFGNTLTAWAVAIGAAVGMTLVLMLARRVIRTRLERLAERTRTGLDDLASRMVGRTAGWFLAAESAVVASISLALPVTTRQGLQVLAVLALMFQAGLWGGEVLDYVIHTRLQVEHEQGDAAGATSVRALGYVARLALWVVVVLLALQNAGIEVTALVTSLGIAGVAVALALQNILGDLFASLAIVLDKPFVIDDVIVVGEFQGAVERIGLKTTRLRSLSGEEISIANSDLLQSRIRNFQRMAERRVVFGFGVNYETPPGKLGQIGGWVREIIEAQDNTRFDRAHFTALGEFALQYEAVYYILSPDYNTYMDIHQAVNLALVKRLQSERVEFAYPTQVVHLARPTETRPNGGG